MSQEQEYRQRFALYDEMLKEISGHIVDAVSLVHSLCSRFEQDKEVGVLGCQLDGGAVGKMMETEVKMW